MPLSRAERQIQARLAQVLADQKLVLFGVSTEASKAARARIAAVQHERYGAAGLRHVPVDDMPAAIEALFSSLDLRRGERLLEIGPGPHGGGTGPRGFRRLGGDAEQHEFPLGQHLGQARLYLSFGS